MSKVFVSITADHDTNGIIKPRILHWKDGCKFEIGKVYDVRQAASLKAGGVGMRYNCKIAGSRYFCSATRVNGLWREIIRPPGVCAGGY